MRLGNNRQHARLGLVAQFIIIYFFVNYQQTIDEWAYICDTYVICESIFLQCVLETYSTTWQTRSGRSGDEHRRRFKKICVIMFFSPHLVI